MNCQDILDELKTLGRAGYKELLMRNHGIPEPFFGVPVSELQKIRKRIKKDHHLALELYATGNYDACYLAGLIADDARMTRADLNRWAGQAAGGPLSGCTVPWVAAGSPQAREMAALWIDSPFPHLVQTGWATVAGFVSVTPDEKLDLVWLESLLERMERDIHQAPDRVRYQMNGCLIAVGCYVPALTEKALAVAGRIGPVTCDLGNNSCQVPSATDHINKVRALGRIGKKRKSAKC